MICQPLTQLLKKPPADGSSPVWTYECTVAFEELKRQLVSTPILVSPCWTKEFHVYVDASNVALGVVLSQKDDKNFDHPIYYASWQLVATERNYSITEREALDSFPVADLFVVDVISEEYTDLIQYLIHNTYPPYITDKMKTQLVYKSVPYTLIGGVLYKKGCDDVLRRCIFPSEMDTILEPGCHLDSCGGHFASDSTARKALMAGYWWPSMFSDAHQFVRRCDACQRIGRPTSSSAMLLVPILAQALFEKWGIDFVGPIASASRFGQKCYILVATDYVTKWTEAAATKIDNANTVPTFLYENIITRFGCPKELVSERGTHFINHTIAALTTKYEIKHCKTTPYYPRANGQTEKTNGGERIVTQNNIFEYILSYFNILR